MDCKSYVLQISQEIEASRKTRLWQDSIHMLSTVSESIFSRSAHFILELLQNAEDAGAANGSGKGEITFSISPDRIKVTHNGTPFVDTNVNAICGVRSSKKPEEGTLGYLGIGFKSVFKISDCPQVHSGGFHFKFDKGSFPDPLNEPWQITPIWIDEVFEPLDPTLTTFILPFRNGEAYSQTLDELRKLDVHLFLFLRWLNKLNVVEETREGKNLSIENLGEKDGVAALRKNNKLHRFVVFRRVCEVPPHVATDRSLEFYKRQTVKQREIVLAFAVDEANDLQPIDDASALGSVSSFFPLVEERTGARFLIQSDFLVQPGREAIQYELSWNHWLIEQATEVAKQAIGVFKKHPRWGKGQFLPLFKFQPYYGQPSFDKLFSPKLQQPLAAYLKTNPVYPTESGGHVIPEQAVQLEEPARGLISDSDLPLLFPSKAGLRLARFDIDIKSMPESIQVLVQPLELGEIVRCKLLVEEKARQPEHVQWFVRLFQAMADTKRYFKEDSSISPIYVLTDKDMVVPAKSACLREMPEDVQLLRVQYPEIDGLLSSYQLIHPGLSTDTLIPFFKERTHVRPIDYGRICREVFLPKLKTTVQAPHREQLIAYTRLLQKGPEIRDTIWVLTDKGKIVQSNQVFLGSTYSPSEDWEKLSNYSSHLDFLSNDYLVDVPAKDSPSWKNFFILLGAKERGGNVDVESFAMEFVRYKLASQLSNFITKTQKQHGYDLEADHFGSGTLVKLEVKGRKKEEEIDLVGNEPEAARQAKRNGEEFWVCIVPGIPENPELWIVKDVADIGQSNALTLPISIWKKYGHRFV